MKSGWKTAPFERCIEQVTYTQKVQRKDFLDNGAYPVVSQEEDFINGYWNNKDDLFKVTTPIVVFGDHTKVLKYVDFDFVLGADGVKVLQPRDFLLPKFFFYQLQTANLDSLGYARHYKLLKELEIAYPDRTEQQRIIEILDETVDGIATAKANAERNRQSARAIFESCLQSAFAEVWRPGELVTLSDLASDITDGDHMPPPKAASGVPFITIGNIVKDTRTIDFADTFMVSREYFDRLKPNKKPKTGDVLYTVTGSFGVPVLISESRDFCFQRHIGLVRPKQGVNSQWLFYLLMSPQVLGQANDGATGTAQKTVSLRLLRGFQVPRVPLALQEIIASRLNTITEETQRLESIYERKLVALDELKKVLLHQAFSGQL
jgi:type I restriction enzyme S subunit